MCIHPLTIFVLQIFYNSVLIKGFLILLSQLNWLWYCLMMPFDPVWLLYLHLVTKQTRQNISFNRNLDFLTAVITFLTKFSCNFINLCKIFLDVIFMFSLDPSESVSRCFKDCCQQSDIYRKVCLCFSHNLLQLAVANRRYGLLGLWLPLCFL